MSAIIDISLPLEKGTSRWPGSEAFRLESKQSLDDGDMSNESAIHMGAHGGTHIDAPSHFIQRGATIDDLSLNLFTGPAYVLHIPRVRYITDGVLRKANIPPRTERILFRTRNSARWKSKKKTFTREYTGLTATGAQWLVERGIRLVGLDFLSVAAYEDIERVHHILLGSGMALLEGITLADVQQGRYMLFCAPVKISGAEGAPARAQLIACTTR